MTSRQMPRQMLRQMSRQMVPLQPALKGQALRRELQLLCLQYPAWLQRVPLRLPVPVPVHEQAVPRILPETALREPAAVAASQPAFVQAFALLPQVRLLVEPPAAQLVVHFAACFAAEYAAACMACPAQHLVPQQVPCPVS